MIELADSVSELPLLCLLVGVGLRGRGELGTGVVEILIGEQLADPRVEMGTMLSSRT